MEGVVEREGTFTAHARCNKKSWLAVLGITVSQEKLSGVVTMTAEAKETGSLVN